MSDVPPEFRDVLATWQPVPEEVTGPLTPWPAAALAALLGAEPPADGDPLPPLWSEVYLRSALPVTALAADGHPAGDGLVPPLPDRRRMFGGGRVEVTEPLRVGEVATRRSTVADVRVREGRSGWLLLVTELHEHSVAGRPRVRERRDIVYRRAEDVRPPGPRDAAAAPAGPTYELHPDERLLFCFSALTYNAHRIHYDRRFTVEVEGHPDLLVHGPLLAIGAVEAARRGDPREIRELTYRLTAPAYPTTPVAFRTEADSTDLTRVTGVQGGDLKVQASVTWRDEDEGAPHA